MANNAIGILFEVKGGGDINGETGKRINGQLRNLVGQINKTDTLRLKFQIDSNHINKQIKQLQQQLQELSSGGTSSSGRKGSSNTSNASQQTKAYRAATAAMREYYDAQLKYARRSSRTSNPSVKYKELYTSVEMAKQKMSEYFDFGISYMKPKKMFVKTIIKLGLPSGLTQAIMSSAMIIVQSLTNQFGELFIAANVVIMRVDGFATCDLIID